MGADISHLKQNGTRPNPDIVIGDIHEEDQSKKITKSHSSYTHFSDYSMFPDRFNGSSQPIALGGNAQHHGHQEEQPHFSDFSLYPDKFDQSKMKMHRSLSETPPAGKVVGQVGTSLPTQGFISKYNFRLRRNSESDHHGTTDSLAPSETEGYRARSLSNSKMYYFDFSLIPDKDPHCAMDEKRKKHNSDDKVLPTVREGTSAPAQVPIQVPKRVRKTTENRFGFFDYSMIPDKDPKCFNSKK